MMTHSDASTILSQIDLTPWLHAGLTIAYLFILGLISLYGLHRYWLLWLYHRHRRQLILPQSQFTKLPSVTVQLPMFNESLVAQRIIDAACRLDYPRHLLQIQVLDDSTDRSADIAAQRVAHWARQGYDIQYLHRTNRQGFKAGALSDAMRQAKGTFIAIFDADFVPCPDFLKKTIHHFTDPGVGMIQTRWAHLNREQSLLTRSQAIFLDGHFVIEHTARNRAKRWINFNGTAGLWRKEAIESAGGWQHDTLTEDVDLSYRAQLKSWRFVYLNKVTCPAELPPEINAFKSQQHRWTKGSIQTAIKLLPTLMKSDAPWPVKMEAFFHLTSPMVYLYMTLMTLLLFPALKVNVQPVERGTLSGLFLGATLFALGTVSATAFYLASQRAQGRSAWTTMLQVPMLMSIGVGIALNNARACIEAIVGHESPFVRTPKYDAARPDETSAGLQDPAAIHRSSGRRWRWLTGQPLMAAMEIGMGLYMLVCLKLAVEIDTTLISVPFLVMFAAGYLYVGLASLWLMIPTRRQRREPSGHALLTRPDQPAS